MTIFIIGYAIKKHPTLRFKPGRGMSGLGCVAEGVRFGLPPMIQSSLTATGSLLLQSFMNSFAQTP